jgi:hypothetical protein
MKSVIVGSLVALGVVYSGSMGAENTASAPPLTLWYQHPAARLKAGRTASVYARNLLPNKFPVKEILYRYNKPL